MLTRGDEGIIRAIGYYRFATAIDIAHLLYSLKSKSYVNKKLLRLSGSGDNKENQYLYRFALPVTRKGNSERVYTLGAKGRDFLEREAGVPVNWHFRPEKVRHLGYGQMVHNLLLTRMLVSFVKSGFVKEMRIAYELPHIAVIPDGWVLFEVKNEKYPVLLEIDRGTEYQERFKKHILARVEFIANGTYEQVFKQKAVTIAYIATGDTPGYRTARRKAMQTWAREVLKEQGSESWGRVFRFAEVALGAVYETRLFDDALWYRPDAGASCCLLEG